MQNTDSKGVHFMMADGVSALVSFLAIFRNAWLVRVHPWVNTIFFLETIGPIELQIGGKMCSQNQFFGFESDGMGFLGESLKTLFGASFPPPERLNSILSYKVPFPQKRSRPTKMFFSCFLGKFCFLRKNC